MKRKTLSVILSCVCLLLIQVLDSAISHANTACESGQRVLNGVAADPTEFPYLLRLDANDVFCGASIISNYFVLTAAHCVFNEECSAIKLSPSTWIQGTTPTIQAAQCYVHEGFTGPRSSDDIALIKTSDDLLAEGMFKAIPLSEPGTQYLPGTPVVVVGWETTEHGSSSFHLLRGDVQVIDYDTCSLESKQASDACKSLTDCPVANLPRKTLCARGQGPNPSGICFGDSGGPAVINGVLAGVVYGAILHDGGCKIGTSALTTNVVDHLPWIHSIIEPA